MDDGARETGNARSRKNVTEEGRYPPDFMAPRRREQSWEVQCRLDDVEPCLVAISIINTMKNNWDEAGGAGRAGTPLGTSGIIEKIAFLLLRFFVINHWLLGYKYRLASLPGDADGVLL